MLKKIFSLLMIAAIFSVTILPVQIAAQSLTNKTTENKTSADLKQVFAKTTTENSALRLDEKKLEKDYRNSSRQKLSGGQKTALYIGIAAAVAAVIVIVLVAGKDDDDVSGFAYAGCPGGNTLCQ